MNIDGNDFTFEQGKYVVSFGQGSGLGVSSGQMGLVFKLESGNTAGNNASFYPANYPGLAKGTPHTITLYADTVIGSFVLSETVTLDVDANGVVSFDAPEVVSEHAISLENASLKIGGTYGENAYYRVKGDWSGVGWIVNDTPTNNDIYLDYSIVKETRTAGSVYGVARMTQAVNAWDILDNGVTDFVSNNTAGTWKNIANSTEILLKYDANAHRRSLNNSFVWGYPTSNVSSIKNCGDVGGNDGVTTAYEIADELGAKHFGLAWGAGTYSVDYKLAIYDSNYDDLGVRLSQTNLSNGSVVLSGAIGKKIYFTPNLPMGTVLDSIAILDQDGNDLGLTIEQNNGDVYSFVMPNCPVKISVKSKTATYTLTCGSTQIEVSPNQPIGALPEGNWFVDGVEISEFSHYVWTENKTATNNENVIYFEIDGVTVWKQYYDPNLNGADVNFPAISAKTGYTASWQQVEFNGGTKRVSAVFTLKVYTLTFMVDGNVYETIEFTMETESIQLPVIPYKNGYVIVGWDITEFPTSNQVVNAIYTQI